LVQVLYCAPLQTAAVHWTPHCPTVGVPFTQSPFVPQVWGVTPLHVVALGSWQFIPSQHAPSQTNPPAQLLEHLCVVVLQALPVGQSPGTLQPQEPVDSQAVPMVAPVQTLHVSPPIPQLALAVPCVHSPVAALQQPALQVADAPHPFEHACVVRLHA
jgi:hypothetical protein